MSSHDDYRDEARQPAERDPDLQAQEQQQDDNLEAVAQARRDRLNDYADHDWS